MINTEKQKTPADQISDRLNKKYGFYREIKDSNTKIREQKKIFISNFFRDFSFLIDRAHQNIPSDQLSASLNKKYEQTRVNNRKTKEKLFMSIKSTFLPLNG